MATITGPTCEEAQLYREKQSSQFENLQDCLLGCDAV